MGYKVAVIGATGNVGREMLQTLSFSARSQNLPAIMSSLSHEINQPLGVIRLNADFLQVDDANLTPQERQQILQQMVTCSEAVNSVVKDFRRFLQNEISSTARVMKAAQLQPE